MKCCICGKSTGKKNVCKKHKHIVLTFTDKPDLIASMAYLDGAREIQIRSLGDYEKACQHDFVILRKT